jgi:hypothetical protein
MAQSWQDGLRSLQRQFDRVAQPYADLWHGVAWSGAALWNEQALEAHPDTILRRTNGQVEYGRFFGADDNGAGWSRFRGLATSAYRLLLRAPCWAEIIRTIRLPNPARDLSACWLGTLYTLAWTREDAVLQADQQYRCLMDDEGEGYSYTQARLAPDVFASSVAAIDLLLGESPPTRESRPARRRAAGRSAAQPAAESRTESDRDRGDPLPQQPHPVRIEQPPERAIPVYIVAGPAAAPPPGEPNEFAPRPPEPTAEWCLLPAYEVRWEGPPVRVTPRLHELLRFLLGRRHYPIEVIDLEEGVWGQREVNPKTLANTLSRLNNALESTHFPWTWHPRAGHVERQG